MLIVKLQGGLGNQLFQYATARALSLRMNRTLKFDIELLKQDPLREYRLHLFNVEEKFAHPNEVAALLCPRSHIWRWLRSRFLRILGLENHILRDTNYRPGGKIHDQNVYLDGYWQDERYFKSVAKVIRNDLTVKNAPDAKNRELLQKIKNSEAVSVHIRRGDYVTNPEASRTHGVLSDNYYHKAFNRVTQTVGDPHMYVFSDDMRWARENIQYPCPVTFVDHNHDREHEDLRLMKYCKYHILANSSFSWWGAWLSGASPTRIIAPERWFHKPSKAQRDPVPKQWIRI